jgi:hypothetical protein
MTNFNTKQFDDALKAADFIVEAHKNGETLTVDNTDKYSSPHMHSHQEYEVAVQEDGTVGVKPLDSGIVYPTPEGTVVIHSG